MPNGFEGSAEEWGRIEGAAAWTGVSNGKSMRKRDDA
jgi:hypothetical protein